MSVSILLPQIIERTDRLLAHHAQLRNANALLQVQVQALTQERDSLQVRLNAARTRNDELLALLNRQPAPKGDRS